MRLRTVLVVGLVAATVLVNPLRAEPATPNPYSVKLGMAQGPNQRAFSLAACGRRGRRRDLDAPFSWKDIEETRGVFTWQATDQQVANARAKGVKVLGTITYTPDFARHPDCPDQPCAGSDHVRRLRPLRRRSRPGTRARSTPGRSGTNPTRPAWKPKPNPAGTRGC